MFSSLSLSINEKFTYSCSWQANSRPSDGVSTAAHKTQTNNARPDKTDQSRTGFKVAVTCVVVCSICFPQTLIIIMCCRYGFCSGWPIKAAYIEEGISDTFHAPLVLFRKLSITRAFAKTVNSFLFYKFEVDANFAFFLLFLTSKPRQQRSGARQENIDVENFPMNFY